MQLWIKCTNKKNIEMGGKNQFIDPKTILTWSESHCLYFWLIAEFFPTKHYYWIIKINKSVRLILYYIRKMQCDCEMLFKSFKTKILKSIWQFVKCDFSVLYLALIFRLFPLFVKAVDRWLTDTIWLERQTVRLPCRLSLTFI